ncbi:MAG: polymer-forming cytoskeletal protein [Candidatus Magasanikbacteria bacterium]|jgi:cytoskeletal protein CcmA (bactofilin family)|nr:polymer-forming cytoskeletal protein [Candidatus Magasanikbacteria bacterium]MBT5262946.1 polymer-forming cytoskeletal protein [Candidatus Magasanikbacteria bacterium]MBT5820676.1 polymer-forming cytoskeletal protein [Candidatus Magasanikbacteria bacterium]MBT6294411.1 polymer-forming cytoskeletal protein [Candidatus Magasanikbacteria bacterium]
MFQKNSDIYDTSEEQEGGVPDKGLETIVGPSMQVEGNFSSEGNIIIKGSVSGTVKTKNRLTAEEGSQIVANVSAQSAVIAGHVKGSLAIKDTLEIAGSAQIIGDIQCATLSVAPGALLSGKIQMKGLESVVKIEETPKRRSAGRVKKKKTDDMVSDVVSSKDGVE